MNPSQIFILRPVATSLLTGGILLAGAVAYTQLPVSALPQVDYPTIQILTFYPGASPEVMASSVTTPPERQFGQLPGLSRMTSTSSSGASLVTLQFNLDLNIHVAEQHVRAANSQANLDQPKGNLEGARQSFTIAASRQLSPADEYRAIVVAYRNGAPVGQSDVANMVEGAENVKEAARMNGKPAVIVIIQ